VPRHSLKVSLSTSLLAALAATAMVAGCSTPIIPPTASGGSASNCSWESAPQVASGSTSTVVLVDDTASFLGTDGQIASPHSGDLATLAGDALTKDFGDSGTNLVSFGTFDGASTSVSWKLSKVALPVGTGDDVQVQNQQQSAQDCLVATVKSALASAASRAPGTDVMAALAAAAQELQGTPATADHVILITDGLSNTGCLDLSTALSQGKSAPEVLASCPEKTELTSLKGVSLEVDGVGFQSGKPLPTADQALVQNYWTDMCTVLGVASSRSCVASEGDDVTLRSTVTRLPDPAITFPSVGRHVPSVLIPGDLLFAFDSAQLSATGQAYLSVLAGQIKAQGRHITKVVGHTDAQGGAQYNLALSQRRAQTVSGYLGHYGFSGITDVGVGEADPACSPQYTSAGAPIQSCMAKNRRVQIMLGG
jgi:outer membrane protein OmpA-like peptidoglycan-associated protein